MSKNSFLKQATILGLAGVLIKILGAAFKIPLGNKIGAVGMGYYNAPYSVYMWLMVLSSVGIPTAIAIMVSERETIGDGDGIRKIIKTVSKPMMLLALILFSILFFGANIISKSIKIDESMYGFMTLAPALLAVPMLSIFRGYFQGVQNLKPYALSQIIEQFTRVIIGLSLAYILFSYGSEYSAAGAVFGASAGSFVGLLAIYIMFRKDSRSKVYKVKSDLDERTILKKLLSIAIPITIGASIVPAMNTVDLVLVVRRLDSIGTPNSLELYGVLTGFALTIVNFPQITTASIQISLVPAIRQLTTEIYGATQETLILKSKQLSDTINTGIKVTMVIGFPCALGLVSLSSPIMSMIFYKQKESALIGGDILKVLAWNLIFISLFQVTTGILQGLEKQRIPAMNLTVGLVLKIVFTYILVGIPKFGIYGAAISTIIAFAGACVLNVIYLYRIDYIEFKFIRVIIKPLLNSLIMGVTVVLSYNLLINFLSSNLSTIISILIGIITYGILIVVTKTLLVEEYEMLPGGSKIKKILFKK